MAPLTRVRDDGIVVGMEIDANFVATLATKDDLMPLTTRQELAAAIAALATKKELAAAIAPLATKEELATAIAPLATRVEVHAAIRSDGEETRRHFDVVAERLQNSINLIAEEHVALNEKIDNVRSECKADVAALDHRVTRLESRRR